jgi:glycosyltransferase involved in cell wall biosynthesis
MASIRKIPFVINTDGNLLCYKYILKGALPKFPYVLYDLITLKSAAKRADAVIVTSKIEYEDAVKFGIKKEKIKIIPIGIDASLYDGDIDSVSGNKILDSDGKIKLLFAGRLSRDRNLEPILYAVKELPEVVFYVIGGDLETSGFTHYNYRETLKKLSVRLGIDNRVKFIGQQSEKELIGWYKQTDIFINTSKYESFGTAILEAAASGLPVISTPVGVANEIVKDCYSGFIVPDEPRFIAQRIKELFSEKLRTEFGSRLRKSAVDSFGWQNVMDKYIKLYEDLSR